MLSQQKLEDAVFTYLWADKLCSRLVFPNPTTKQIRLALDLLPHFYPLWNKLPIEEKAEIIIDLFKFNIPIERITSVKPFKKILFKKVISDVTEHNSKIIIKTTKVRRLK